jgi:hypothetical protein
MSRNIKTYDYYEDDFYIKIAYFYVSVNFSFFRIIYTVFYALFYVKVKVNIVKCAKALTEKKYYIL